MKTIPELQKELAQARYDREEAYIKAENLDTEVSHLRNRICWLQQQRTADLKSAGWRIEA